MPKRQPSSSTTNALAPASDVIAIQLRAPPTAKRTTTSSERGRKYRARMNHLVTTLECDVEALRHQVAELDARRSLVEARRLRHRHDAHGSLARLVHKYYTLFEESMASLPPPATTAFLAHNEQAARELEQQYRIQARFLFHIMDPQVVAGDLVGPLAILDQWHRYQSTHASFRAHVVGIETSGDEDDPVVTLHAQATGKITGATFYTLFPHAVRDHDDALVQRLLNKPVTYTITNRYLFRADGRIREEIVTIDFVKGLVDAGATVMEVARLMSGATISPHCTIHSREHGAGP